MALCLNGVAPIPYISPFFFSNALYPLDGRTVADAPATYQAQVTSCCYFLRVCVSPIHCVMIVVLVYSHPYVSDGRMSLDVLLFAVFVVVILKYPRQ